MGTISARASGILTARHRVEGRGNVLPEQGAVFFVVHGGSWRTELHAILQPDSALSRANAAIPVLWSVLTTEVLPMAHRRISLHTTGWALGPRVETFTPAWRSQNSPRRHTPSKVPYTKKLEPSKLMSIFARR